MLNKIFLNSKTLLFIRTQFLFRKITFLIKNLESEILEKGNPNKIKVMQFVNGELVLRKFSSSHSAISIIIAMDDRDISAIQIQDQSTGKNIITWKAMLGKYRVVKLSSQFKNNPYALSYAEEVLTSFSSGVNPSLLASNGGNEKLVLEA